MNPFEFTNSICIELSNLCQYSWLHKKCPLHLQMVSPWRVKEPKILDAGVVYGVLWTLGKFRYDKTIYFHQHNEPLIDPRLFMFIARARAECPEAQIIIETNGHYLTPSLAQELVEQGVTRIVVTLYGSRKDIDAKNEYYLAEYQSLLVDCVSRGGLDSRLEAYTRPYADLEIACPAPLDQVVITRNATVGLCCMDWEYRYTFGNLKDQTLDEILLSLEIRGAYERLSSGDRFFDICRRCKTRR